MLVLLYAAETWTLLSCDEKTLEAFHMKCQRQILHTHWSLHVTNAEISARTGLPPVMDLIRRRRLSVFGHIARLTQGTPAHMALHCPFGLASGRSLGRDWRRRLGRPRVRWTDQLRTDTGSAPANLWRQAIPDRHLLNRLRTLTIFSGQTWKVEWEVKHSNAFREFHVIVVCTWIRKFSRYTACREMCVAIIKKNQNSYFFVLDAFTIQLRPTWRQPARESSYSSSLIYSLLRMTFSCITVAAGGGCQCHGIVPTQFTHACQVPGQSHTFKKNFVDASQ